MLTNDIPKYIVTVISTLLSLIINALKSAFNFNHKYCNRNMHSKRRYCIFMLKIVIKEYKQIVYRLNVCIIFQNTFPGEPLSHPIEDYLTNHCKRVLNKKLELYRYTPPEGNIMCPCVNPNSGKTTKHNSFNHSCYHPSAAVSSRTIYFKIYSGIYRRNDSFRFAY